MYVWQSMSAACRVVTCDLTGILFICSVFVSIHSPHIPSYSEMCRDQTCPPWWIIPSSISAGCFIYPLLYMCRHGNLLPEQRWRGVGFYFPMWDIQRGDCAPQEASSRYLSKTSISALKLEKPWSESSRSLWLTSFVPFLLVSSH